MVHTPPHKQHRRPRLSRPPEARRRIYQNDEQPFSSTISREINRYTAEDTYRDRLNLLSAMTELRHPSARLSTSSRRLATLCSPQPFGLDYHADRADFDAELAIKSPARRLRRPAGRRPAEPLRDRLQHRLRRKRSGERAAAWEPISATSTSSTYAEPAQGQELKRLVAGRGGRACAAAPDGLRGLIGDGRLGPPLCVVFEGWDASGKGGAIKRLVAAARPAPRARRAVRRADPRREAPPLPAALLAGAAGLGRDGRARPLVVRARARRARRGLRDRAAVAARLRRDRRLRADRSPPRA